MKTWDEKTEYAFSHVKRDGWNINVEVTATGRIKYWTSGWRLVDLSFLTIHERIFEFVPPRTMLQCELWKPGAPASYVATGIKHKDIDMRLECFAIESSLVFENSSLEAIQAICYDWQVPFIPFSLGMPVDPKHLDEHSEGWVFKNGNLLDHVKYKPFKDATLRIVGVEAGKGKFEGLIGSLEVALEDGTVVANVSGMTDLERHDMTLLHQQGQLLKKLVDVTYQYVNSRGRLRHANFSRFRPDKQVADTNL